MIKRYLTTHNLALTGVTAALYFCLTVFLHPVSYSVFQFRISEIMNLLAFINPAFAPGIILGCLISNIFSPLGIADMVIGTFATVCTMYFVTRSKNMFFASLWPVVFMVFIAAEFYFIYKLPFFMSYLTLAMEEFVVTTLIGYPMFKIVLRNKTIEGLLKHGYSHFLM